MSLPNVKLMMRSRRANAAAEKEIVLPAHEDESLGAVFGVPLEQVRSYVSDSCVHGPGRK